MKLAKHFEKAAKHHQSVAEEHHGLHQLHKSHAAHHESEGDTIKAAHHREVATHHAQLVKLHKAHAEHLAEMAADHGLKVDDQPDVFAPPTSKLSDAAFFKSMLGVEG